MKILIKNGTVINPKTDFEQKADVLIEDGMIASIEDHIEENDANVIDATGSIITPGLVDIHVHFRDPGFTEKETVATGIKAAAAGGFTSVVCMPNTKPTIDSPEILDYIEAASKKEGTVHVYSSASITKGLKGEEMTNLDELAQSGAVTFTDDGKTVMNPKIVYDAFQKAKQLGVPISSHCEDHHFITKGSINKGKTSQVLNDPGISRLGEELIVARDILMAEETGAHVHIQHVTTQRVVQLVREAKSRGVNVTCEAAPHHFSLTDESIIQKGALGKVNPPLRTQEDVEALIQGLEDGTIDAIATDHAPHTTEEKNKGLSEAPFGLVGLETSVGLTFTKLYHTGKLTLKEIINKMSVAPASIMNMRHGNLSVGERADVTIIDPHYEWVVDPKQFYSKSTNMPFEGWKLKGKVMTTIADGREIFSYKGRNDHNDDNRSL